MSEHRLHRPAQRTQMASWTSQGVRRTGRRHHAGIDDGNLRWPELASQASSSIRPHGHPHRGGGSRPRFRLAAGPGESGIHVRPGSRVRPHRIVSHLARHRRVTDGSQGTDWETGHGRARTGRTKSVFRGRDVGALQRNLGLLDACAVAQWDSSEPGYAERAQRATIPSSYAAAWAPKHGPPPSPGSSRRPAAPYSSSLPARLPFRCPIHQGSSTTQVARRGRRSA
jgi:hypothetical protein